MNVSAEVLNWITAIASVFTAFGVLVVVWQVKTDHARARREKLIDLLSQWIQLMSPALIRHASLTLRLNKEQMACLRYGRSIKIQLSEATEYLYEFGPFDGQEIQLPVEVSRQLMSDAITMLNVVEAAALAYKYGVTDREMMQESLSDFLFRYDFLESCNRFVVESNWGAWPAIQWMYQERSKNREL